MQTNNIKYLKYKPLQYVLISLLVFLVVSLINGQNGWGPPASNEQAIGEISRWCERVSGGFFREPSNTLGNLGFIATGLYMFLTLARDSVSGKGIKMFGSSAIALLYASASTFLGPGSMAMHGTHTSFGAWLDNVSMITYILILWLYNLKRLMGFSIKTYFIIYSLLLGWFAYSYWFIGGGLGIGINLFELSIGLWIATEVLVKFPNIYGRVGSGFAVLIIQQLFGNPVINALQNFQENWEMLLYFIPALIVPKTSAVIRKKYTPWFFLGFASFFGALIIWGTGVPGHPWCNPDSWLQAHMVWHMLCSVATLSFFNLYRTEVLLGD
ncbi:MAG: hypothetical protein VYD26_00180 [Actinomycetota bacterium]|nr:hypothetical protein [Actinomycetota bacterium]